MDSETPENSASDRSPFSFRQVWRSSSSFFRANSFTGYDAGEFQINFTTAPDASIDETRGRIHAVLTSLKGIPEVKHTYATIGAGDQGTVRDAMVYVKLVDRKERKRHQKTIQEEVRDTSSEDPWHPAIHHRGREDG